jgi:ADP-heptose:LPS heptosyltransferase
VIAPTLANNAHRPVKIGLFWRSNDSMNDHRACHLSEFISLTENLRASFFSLQPTILAEERELLAKHNINNLVQEITTYSQAGALMQQMDLIVTVTAPIAHLSGALGLPTIVLAPYQFDWQWAGTDESSNWYPGVKVLRQQKIGDWTSSLEQCRQLIGDITG